MCIAQAIALRQAYWKNKKKGILGVQFYGTAMQVKQPGNKTERCTCQHRLPPRETCNA